MKKWLFFLAICSVSPVSAKTVPAPGSFGVSAEWLYFNIGQDDLFIGTDTASNGLFNIINGSNHINSLRWHSGVRAEILYRFCDDVSGLVLRSTYFPRFSNKKTIEGTFRDPIFTEFTRRDADFSYNFFNVEFLYDHDILSCCPFNLSLQAGLQFAYLHFKNLFVDTFFETFFTNFNGTRRGIGPEIGLEWEYFLCSALSLDMRASASLLIAQKKNHWSTTPLVGFFTGILNDETFWSVIPTSDLRLGFNYCFPFEGCRCHFVTNLAFGYEVLFYSQAFSKFNVTDRVESYFNFFGHGPYLQLGAAF